MTRARAIWLAAGVVVLAAAALLLRHRSRQSEPLTASAAPSRPARGTRAEPPPATAVTAPVTAMASEEAAINEPPSIEEEPPVRSEAREVVEPAEQPLATWVRVAIIAVALLAFLAVSLIATKQV